MTLGEYIKAKTGAAFAWGSNDCATFPADWLAMNGRNDPMAEWRGQYGCESEANEIIARRGGLGMLWLYCLGEPDNSLEDGAVAIAEFENGHIGGIVSGDRLIMLREKGIAAIGLERLHIVASWGLGNG